MRKSVRSFVLVILASAGSAMLHAQSPVSVGQGSYASFPPAEELQFEWEGQIYYNDYDFVYNNEIYVSDNETRPIPTNDWWTNLLVEQYGGLMFAYPLVMQPSAEGLTVQYPVRHTADGSNLDRGNGLRFKAPGFAPTKAIASNWSDWHVEMKLPDAPNGKTMTVTMAHGVPFVWVETQGFSPQLEALSGATYLTETGSPVTFPVQAGGRFILSTEDKLLGIYLGQGATATLEGKQYAQIDLGAVLTIGSVNLIWEAAYASGYTLQTSNDGVTWSTVTDIVNGTGGEVSHVVNRQARYVRLLLNERGTVYAYSLFEFEVWSNGVNVALNKSVTVTSTQDAFAGSYLVDGNTGTRWASNPNAKEALVINMPGNNGGLSVGALQTTADLLAFAPYAYNKPIDTKVTYNYNVTAGTVETNWQVSTQNINGTAGGAVLQGFLPHQYKSDRTNGINYLNHRYVTARGAMKIAAGNSFSFSYPFTGIVPNFTSPYKNAGDASPYSADVLYQLITNFSAAKTGYGADTYWGGKDLVNLAKYTLMAKELNHQAYESLKERTREALVNWLTYTPGETSKYFARYDRWKALVGFDQSYGSAQFTDNHFHYGYLIHAAGLYGMIDQEFLAGYGDMLRLVTKQYANWDRNDTFLPYFRTFDPWIGHSYAGGTSSGGGNNQESTSEAMQSWVGMFLLGNAMGDNAMRDAAAFGYLSEAAATLEYWFDWDQQNLPAEYPHDVVGILWNGGYSYGTYFSASPVHIHGIQYLPVCPGFHYLARNKTWALREYNDMMNEAAVIDGHGSEIDFGDDWAHVALGFRTLFDPTYVTSFMTNNLGLGGSDPQYIMDYEVSGMTYFYAHALQNLGDFSTQFRTNFPASNVFEKNGAFSHAVAFNASNQTEQCHVYNEQGAVIATFSVPARSTVTYPSLPDIGKQPTNCYALMANGTASSGDVSAALDASGGTRWIAASTGNETITLNFGQSCSITDVTIDWEVASAKTYQVLGSVDGTNWFEIRSFANMSQGNRTDVVDADGVELNYLRISMTEAATPWPYSIYEISVCGRVAQDVPTGIVVPSKIEAEDYIAMRGIQTEGTTDVGGGLNVGWIDAGDYMDYSINVSQSGLYTLNYRVASIPGGGQIQCQLNGAVLAQTSVPATGSWQLWTTVSAQVNLPKGQHTIRLYAPVGGYNVNWLEFTASGLKSESVPTAQSQQFEDALIAPNPANESTTVTVVNTSIKSVAVYSLQGRLMVMIPGKAGLSSAEINVSGWQPGYYLVKVVTETGTIVNKLLVE